MDLAKSKPPAKAGSHLRISELAKRSGVTIATLKNYLRQGLIRPARKTGRTMSWYEPALVGRVRAIRELQHRQFLPLEVIKRTLASQRHSSDDHAAAAAISAVLTKHGGVRAKRRAELIEHYGADPRELDWLAAAGLAVPSGPEQVYAGDDLALLATLGDARRAGLTAEMLPFSILSDYLAALRNLVEIERRLFRSNVLPSAGAEVTSLTTAATELSERLVVLLRRKLLLAALYVNAHHESQNSNIGRDVRRPTARELAVRPRRPSVAQVVRPRSPRTVRS